MVAFGGTVLLPGVPLGYCSHRPLADGETGSGGRRPLLCHYRGCVPVCGIALPPVYLEVGTCDRLLHVDFLAGLQPAGSRP